MPVPLNLLLPTEDFAALCEAINDARMADSKQPKTDVHLARLADALRPIARRWGIVIL